jgi:hypothetical protein
VIVANEVLDRVFRSSVDCDLDMDVVCGPIYPNEANETFGDKELQCCYFVAFEAICSP